MPRPHIVIENPILNTPFEAPARHFRINHYDDEVLQVYEAAS